MAYDTNQDSLKNRDTLIELARSIAKLMPEWALRLRDEESAYDCRAFLEKDGLQIGLTLSQGRLNVQTWKWPQYTRIERGDNRSETVWPHQSLHPSETQPSITVDPNKSSEQIVKDIKRRFLPEYERIFKLCLEKAKQYQTNEDDKQTLWASVCKVAGKTGEKWAHIYVTTAKGNIEAEQRSSTVKLTLDIDNAEILGLLIKAMGGVK